MYHNKAVLHCAQAPEASMPWFFACTNADAAEIIAATDGPKVGTAGYTVGSWRNNISKQGKGVTEFTIKGWEFMWGKKEDAKVMMTKWSLL